MKVALITDTHHGFKNGSLVFQAYFQRFFDEVFFPELERRKIDTIIHCGDVFDSRRLLNVQVLNHTRVNLFDRFNQFNSHFIIGNHDCYHRDGNDVNSPQELLQQYCNIHVYQEAAEVVLDGVRLVFLPWINENNKASALELLNNTTAKIVMGHLEVAGFHMDKTQVCEHGLDATTFDRFAAVFSGHFHHASQRGPIRYLGAPYEYTFADLDDAKGFYIFDTETLDLEFIKNPLRMFYRLKYNDQDEEAHKQLLQIDVTELSGKIVRVIVSGKTAPVAYEQWIDTVIAVNPNQLQISDEYCLDVSEEEENEIVKTIKANIAGDPNTVVLSTLDTTFQFIDAIQSDVNKPALKEVMRELYSLACAGAGND